MDQYLTPTAVGILVGVAVQIVSALLQKKKIVVDDNASLRDALMEERTGLVDEIHSLGDRCKNLEDDLRKANEEIIELKYKNAELELEVKQIRGTRDDVKTKDS